MSKTSSSSHVPTKGDSLAAGALVSAHAGARTSSGARPVLSVWAGLCLLAAAVKLSLDVYFPGAFADQDQAALLRWPVLVVFCLAGAVGVWVAERTGFPPAWDENIPVRWRLWFPAGAGVLFGLVMILLDRSTGLSRLIAANHGTQQQYTGFVPMFLVFVLAAPMIVDVVYRLVLVPVLLWLTSSLLLRGKGQEKAFWALALVLSALEPFTQTPDLRVLPLPVRVMDTVLLYALNFTQVVFFRKAGFLASILVRAGFYLMWHVIYVH